MSNSRLMVGGTPCTTISQRPAVAAVRLIYRLAVDGYGMGAIVRKLNADGVPPYVVFHDKTLAEIAERRCKDWADLATISGVGPAKLERYADEVLAVLAAG